jgi:hypothetical protein
MFMKHRKYSVRAALVATGLLLVGILLFSQFSGSKVVWHCSPTQPRPSGVEAWENAIAPAKQPEEVNEAFFDNFTVSSDDEKFTVEHHYGYPPDNAFAHELCEMKPGEPLNIGEGALTFCAMGAAYLNATQTMADDAAYRFFDVRLQGITNEQARELGTHQFTESGGSFLHSPFPAVQFGFHYQGIEDLKFHGLKVYDARTRKLLSGGHSSSGRERHYWFNTHIPLWHRTPVDLVLEVSYGPSKIFDFAPRAGEGFSEGSFECRLLTVLEDVDTYSSESSSRNNAVTHTFRKAWSDKAGLRFVFACQPAASQMPVSFEFLDTDGNILRRGGSSTSGYVRTVDMKQPLEKVALIRARYRTRRQRIVIHLPYIPGLPEENNMIDDLFDVHVPYVSLRDPGKVSQFLRQVLQLKTGRQTGSVPPDSINNSTNSNILFPLEFSDVTIREIAQVYAEGGDLHVDIENERLHLEYPTTFGVRLSQFLQRIFRK